MSTVPTQTSKEKREKGIENIYTIRKVLQVQHLAIGTHKPFGILLQGMYVAS